MRLSLAAAPAVAFLLAAVPARAADPPPARAAGGLAWVFSDEIDLYGTMAADVPLASGAAGTLAARVDLRTAIERSLGELTFAVRDVDYRAELAFGTRRGFEALAGRRGFELVDAAGAASLTYVGAGWASRGHDAAISETPWDGAVAAAVVVDRAGDGGDALVRGAVRFTRRRPAWAWGLDARVEAWPDGSDLRADVDAGARVELPMAGGRALALRVAWVRSRSPFGLGVSGVTAGFDIVEGPWGAPERPSPPEVRGIAALGAGDDGRRSGRLRVAASSPPWRGGWRAVIDVDANVLTARDTGELFYFYHVGLERPSRRVVWGAYLYHRSNHVLAEDNPIGVTSRNVVEAGIETDGWDDPFRPAGSRGGRLDARVRPGWTIDSTFDASPGANLRAGLRWTLPGGSRAVPYLLVEGETGDAERRVYAAGVAFAKPLDVRVAFTSDTQFFGRDRTAWVVAAGLPF